MEQTFVMIKPDGVKQQVMGHIISRLEGAGYSFTHIEMLTMSAALAEQHYQAHKDKPFYLDLVEFITSGPVLAMICQGNDVISGVRDLIGDTDPKKAKEGTIRHDFGTSIRHNVVHSADSYDNAVREIGLFFPDK